MSAVTVFALLAMLSAEFRADANGHAVYYAVWPIVAGLLKFAAYSAAAWAAGQIISALQAERGPKPSAANPVAPPNANSLCIPVLWGTRRISPITVWMVKVTPIKVYTHNMVLGVISQQIHTSYDYKVWCQQILCWGPTDGVRNMVFNQTKDLSSQLAMQPTGLPSPAPSELAALSGIQGGHFIPPYSFPIDGLAEVELWLPFIHGFQSGTTASGVYGKLRFYAGSMNYGPDPMLEAVEPGPTPFTTMEGFVPAYRELVHVVYDGFVVGRTPVAPAIDYIIYRWPNTTIPGASEPLQVNQRWLGGNPAVDPDDYPAGAPGLPWQAQDVTAATILYDVLVNRQYGKGYSASEVDAESFGDAHDVLVQEGLGMSLLVYGNPAPFEQVKHECERTADMVLRRHPETFKWSAKLIRNEAATTEAYNALRAFDESNIRELTWSRKDPSETINQVTVKFANAALLYEQDSVTIRNDANIAMTGKTRPLVVEYMAVTDRAVALKIAARELKAGTLTLGNGTIKVDRSAWDLERGDVFRLSWDKYGLDGVVVRVSDVDLGEPGDNEITVGLVEDVFSYNEDFAIEDDTDDLPPTIPRIRQPPIVTSTTQTQTGDTGTLTIFVFDPDQTIVAIRFRTQVGLDDPSAWDDVATGTPGVDQLGGEYEYDVDLTGNGPSVIAYEIEYKTDFDGDSEFLHGFVVFSTLAKPTIQLTYEWSDIVPGTVSVTAVVPLGTLEVKFAWSLAGVPSDEDVRAAFADSSAPFQIAPDSAIPLGGTMFVAAFAYMPGGIESYKAVLAITNTGNLIQLALAIEFDAGGNWTVTATGGTNVSKVKIATSTTGWPTVADVRAATADTSAPFVLTGGPIADGETLRASAFAYTIQDVESSLANASATFEAEAIPDLIAVYDANDSPRTTDGSGIVTIGDLSGNGFTLTGPGGVGGGTVSTAELNGLDVIRNNSGMTWDCEAAENGLGTAISAVEEFTVAYVATPNSGNSGGMIYASIGSNESRIDAGQGNAGSYRIGGIYANGGMQWLNVASAAMTPGTYDRITFTRDNTGLITIRQNGTVVGTATADDQGSGPGSRIVIGANVSGGDNSDMKWAQVRFYGRVLTSGELTALDDYFVARYGL